MQDSRRPKIEPCGTPDETAAGGGGGGGGGGGEIA